MPTKEQVLQLLRSGDSYEAAARRLGIPAGLAYMIATGIPADYSDSLGPDDYGREGLQLGGTQALLGVPHHNPNQPGEHPEVMAWIRRRASGDGQMQDAAVTRPNQEGDK
jgi:hypothetical protein